MTDTKNHQHARQFRRPTPTQMFVAEIEAIDTMVSRLASIYAGFDCRDATWADVQVVAKLREKLQDATDYAFHEGEYSANV